MGMYVLFGVKASGAADLDAIAGMIENVIGVTPIKRSAEEAGDYFKFRGAGSESIRLTSGTYGDEDGEFPADREFPDWPFLLHLDDTTPQSAWLRALENAGPPIYKLKTEIVENGRKTRL